MWGWCVQCGTSRKTHKIERVGFFCRASRISAARLRDSRFGLLPTRHACSGWAQLTCRQATWQSKNRLAAESRKCVTRSPIGCRRFFGTGRCRFAQFARLHRKPAFPGRRFDVPRKRYRSNAERKRLMADGSGDSNPMRRCPHKRILAIFVKTPCFPLCFAKVARNTNCGHLRVVGVNFGHLRRAVTVPS